MKNASENNNSVKLLVNHDQNTTCTSLLANECFYNDSLEVAHYLLSNKADKKT